MASLDGSSRSMRDEDLNEEEIWFYDQEEKEDSGCSTLRKPREYSSGGSTSLSAWRLPSSTPRIIPRVNNYSSAKHETQQSSAPLNIPDWSKIYGNMDSSSRVDNGDDDDDMVPPAPHEWLARKLARNQISSFSVCEGIGRTLKGRDLSKVRNAVLTKTGFLE